MRVSGKRIPCVECHATWSVQEQLTRSKDGDRKPVGDSIILTFPCRCGSTLKNVVKCEEA